MGELNIRQRQDLIDPYIQSSMINWEHICLAQLVKAGYVGSLLTTNFDLLAVRACALIGLFPAVYDLAVTRSFDPGAMASPSIVHLHGQYHGQVVLHAGRDHGESAPYRDLVINESNRGGPWLVIGYSGSSDPTMDHLFKLENFRSGLYWVSRRDTKIDDRVEQLLEQKSGAYLVECTDAEAFLIELAQKLDCFPPDFLAKPFSLLRQLFENLAPYRLPSGSIGDSSQSGVATTIVASAQRKIDEAIRIFESQAPDQPKPDIAELQRLVMAGQYSEVETLVDKLGPDLTEDIRDILYLAYIGHGLDLTEKALNAEAQEKDSLFTQATNVLEKAMDLKPTASPAIGNLASILTTQAVSAKTVKATGLLQRATSLFEQACKLNPRDSDLVTNWGAAIALQASISPWASQMPRQEAAIEKFARAVELNGENARALTLWGEMLRRQSDHFNGPEGERLVSEAIAKFEQAWALGSRSPGLLTNWATAESTIGFGGGLASHLTNWAMALQRRRDHVRGPEGDAVLAEAISKFRLALKYKPNDVSALVGLSRSLAASTPLRPDGDSAQLSEAESLLKHALSQPASPFCTPSRIHAELAQVLTRRVISQQPQQFPDAMAESLEECVEATRLDPLSPYAWCVFGMTYATIAHYVTIDKRRYLDEAIRKWNRALEIDSNDYLTLANLGMALNWLSKDEPDRRQLLERSEKVFRHLLSTQKNNYFAINQLGHTVFELALLAESEADFSGRIADARTHLIKAAELRPSDPAPLVTLGYLYLETANRVPAKRAKSLEEAKKVLDSANAIQLGIGSYNLACWAAMQSDESECQRYLEESRDNKQLPPRNTIIADRDFKRYAESPWFVKFISSLDH